ncbi:unnamed protein product [Periconia digitata]|uniref:Uncharacterized protein n=1 Tax=Periconia digitata TaxID=1303443 RepID=A0A9W4UJS6_9PLEO|nr:unnamed protein product [Periconia digitata]
MNLTLYISLTMSHAPQSLIVAFSRCQARSYISPSNFEAPMQHANCAVFTCETTVTIIALYVVP